VDRGDHNRKRRMLSHAFATRNLERWEFKIADKIGKLITQIGDVRPRYRIDTMSIQKI
jgi:benzoate 4-monooxygenase